MQFLFETITISGKQHLYYRVYSTGHGKYYAEPMFHEGGFYFWKDGDWVADDPGRQYEAEQIGEVVERRYATD